METQMVGVNIRADRRDCGVPTTLEYKEASGSPEFGTVIINTVHLFRGLSFSRLFYKLYRRSVCSGKSAPGR